MQLFLNYPWEGNVRELEHVIEGAVNFVDGETIEIIDLPYNLKNYYERHHTKSGTIESLNKMDGLVEALEAAEKRLIEEALKESDGNTSAAARLLKIPRQTLQYKMRKFELE
jgi:arginine utilization regulatory protein